MGVFGFLKAQKAIKAHSSGQLEEAEKLYKEALDQGAASSRLVLGYATLLFRSDRYQECKDLLVKYQKLPDLSAEQKNQLITDYAACCFKLGDIGKAIEKLEAMYRKGATGLNYQTLGYLYAVRYDHRDAPEELKDITLLRRLVEEAAPVKPAAEGSEETEQPVEELLPEPDPDPVTAWVKGARKAIDFNREALDYDEDDSVCQDNMAQALLRVLEDKEGAKEHFLKALSLKDTQIDTLWFLSRYDLEEGHVKSAVERLEKAVESGRFSPLNCHTKDEFIEEIARLKAML